jgi:ABC-type transporter Mla subunit MlaD
MTLTPEQIAEIDHLLSVLKVQGPTGFQHSLLSAAVQLRDHARDLERLLSEAEETLASYGRGEWEHDMQSLRAQLSERRAAVLVEALKDTRGPLSRYANSVSSVTSDDVRNRLLPRLDAILSNLPAAAKAHMEEVEGLKKADGYLRRVMNQVVPQINLFCEPDLFATLVDSVIARLKQRAEAAEAQVAALKANQRTPGTVEVCPGCNRRLAYARSSCGWDYNTKGPGDCPLRAAQSGV